MNKVRCLRELLACRQPRPKRRIFLRRFEGLRGIAGIEVLRQRDLLVLDGKCRGMRIGDQHHAFAAGAQFSQKSLRARQESHARQSLAFQRRDIQLQFARPVLDAIPLQRVRDILEFGRQARSRFCLADAVGGGIAARNKVSQNQLSKRKSNSVPSMSSNTVSTLSSRLQRMRACAYDTSMRDLASLAEALMPIVERASAAIMQIYDGAFAVQRKDDNSPLTLADLESQRVIIEGLKRLTPGIPILSEESAPAPWAERQTGANYGWSIRSTARANSSSATVNSPSTSR